MLEKLKSNEGITFLDVMIAIVALLGFTSIMVTTTTFMAKNQQNVREVTQFNQLVHNKVVKIYQVDDWNRLDTEEIEIDDGVVTISYDYLGRRSEYSTEVLNMLFDLENSDRDEVYQIERSVFHE